MLYLANHCLKMFSFSLIGGRDGLVSGGCGGLVVVLDSDCKVMEKLLHVAFSLVTNKTF